MLRSLAGLTQMRAAVQWHGAGRLSRTIGIATPALLLGCASLLWVFALARMDPDKMGDLGLISVMPPWFFAAIGLLTASFALLLRRRPTPGGFLLLHVVALVVMIHATPTILYGTLRYSWAWKHLGIVDYIQRHGSLDPAVAYLKAYHNWPGFFGLAAFAGDAAAVTDFTAIARWAPVYFNLLDLGALVLIFRSLTADRRLVWLSVWFFYLTNWVGQDYFSPQAEAYFLYLVALGICLRWFRRVPLPLDTAARRSARLGWVSSGYRLVVNRAQRTVPADVDKRPSTQAGLLAVTLLILVTLVYSHQLTPVFTVLSLTVLVAFRQLSARALPVLLALGILAWMAYPASPFVRENLGSVLGSIGQVRAHVDENLIDPSRASEAQAFISLVTRGFSAAVGGLALLGLCRRLRHGMWDLAPVLLIAAPTLMLAVDGYGGELLFRVYLFAVPFFAFLAAGLVFPIPDSRAGIGTPALAFALSVLLLAGFSVSYYGKDRQYYFTQNEVEASRFLYTTAPQGSLLVEGSRNYPGQFKNYERHTYVPISREPQEVRSRILRDPEGQMARWMSNPKYTASFLIITRSQKIETEALGDMPPGSLARIETVLRDSPRFVIVFSNRDATIFALKERGS